MVESALHISLMIFAIATYFSMKSVDIQTFRRDFIQCPIVLYTGTNARHQEVFRQNDAALQHNSPQRPITRLARVIDEEGICANAIFIRFRPILLMTLSGNLPHMLS